MNEKNAFLNSIIGEGSRFSGDVDLTGLLRIDGDFSGTIICRQGRVLIGKSGRVNCSIKADTVVIGGAVKGDIIAEKKVIVLSTGLVIGNIQSPRLIVEEGVIIDGNCIINDPDMAGKEGEVRMGQLTGSFKVDWETKAEAKRPEEPVKEEI